MRTPEQILDELLARRPELAPVRPALWAAYQAMHAALAGGGTLFTCGNGGSAADSEHIAGELLKGFLLPRRLSGEWAERLYAAGPAADADYLQARLQGGLRAVALTGHPALATAVINDNGGDLAFAQQLMALGRPGDCLLALSTSGKARNVLLAAHTARAMGVRVVAATGAGGGPLRGQADVWLGVPEQETFKVQELHLPVYHAWCAMLEAAFFGGG
ncbi:MAG: SIS domain-containing protein [Lentisphaeria bacterium]